MPLLSKTAGADDEGQSAPANCIYSEATTVEMFISAPRVEAVLNALEEQTS
ncbi:MAG: hypothetical protein ACE37I_07095 [Rubinisphaera brasiliensis]|uniref:hypothetical protein n=1 Tax=Rubinisphaera brasiliensis TaxID=119 RepID=UPI000314AAA4|nr:hypothetical protein [Rubinisphaera brasiliensis]MBR9802127.1 hypothetical protein [bacterium]